MPNATLKKQDGASAGSVVLSDKLFGAKVTPGLMHQAVLNEATNSRQDTRNTKTRGEVAGGGRKPYKQKGTGRARQGTISAPHYRHGGIVFGPHPRDLSAKLPKKARRAAVASALTVKASEGVVTVIEALTFDTISTKTAAAFLAGLGITGKTLVILGEHTPVIYKSFRNIPGIEVRVAPAFSVRDVMDATQIVIVKSALDVLNAQFGADSSDKETTV
ncbi:MAG: 50S ribosomal protein L4 [Capsulimonas sp.]|uniref:50S ribosomal protein L4 n=1 Tax=Capsulimonas sp. TaxID=2494211 RepID=UPI003263C2F0